MKTIKQLKDRRTTIVQSVAAIRNSKTCTKADFSAIKKYTAEIELIDLCVRYIETGPSEELLTQQLETLTREIAILDGRYKLWDVPNDRNFKSEAAKRTFYNKETGITSRKQRVQTLRYLS